MLSPAYGGYFSKETLGIALTIQGLDLDAPIERVLRTIMRIAEGRNAHIVWEIDTAKPLEQSRNIGFVAPLLLAEHVGID